MQLNLSRHTISDYVKQIYRKLNVSSRAEAALEAQRLGLFGRGRRAQPQATEAQAVGAAQLARGATLGPSTPAAPASLKAV